MVDVTSASLPGGGVSAVRADEPGFRLVPLDAISIGGFDEGAAEILAFDPATDRIYVLNAETNALDVLDAANPAALSLLFSLDLDPFGDGGATSVDVANGVVAVAVQADDASANGSVVLFDDTDGAPLGTIEVGVQPDQLAFSPDGTRIAVANEGEPNEETGDDPLGSVSLIDLSTGATPPPVTFEGVAIPAGVRTDPRQDPTADLEPEFTAFSPDGGTVYVALQENNAIGVIDFESRAVIEILPLGLKDYSLQGFGLDPSNEDGGIAIAPAPVLGLYQPDGIAAYEANGVTYVVTANEGDTREYEFDDGTELVDEADLEDLALDPAAFPDAATLQLEENLGALTVSSIDGDADGDGLFEQIVAFGGRSFSILNAETGEIVFDSGDDFEQITADVRPDAFNADNDELPQTDGFDSRSDNKGPEPEGVVVGEIDGQTFAFVGLERVGGIMMYDITDPLNAEFEAYVNITDAAAGPEADAFGLGPEGLTFVPAADSPTGEPLLAVASEVSGDVATYAIEPVEPAMNENFTLQLLHTSDPEGGIQALESAPRFAALADVFRATASEVGADGTLLISSGDNYIPGPFFNAGANIDPAVLNSVYNQLLNTDTFDSLEPQPGAADIAVLNALGVDASAIGNHEFDAGPGTLDDLISFARATDEDGNPIEGGAITNVGTLFPYLSANLDFSESSLDDDFTDQILPAEAFDASAPGSEDFDEAAAEDASKLARASILEVDGTQIGVVGATTQNVEGISSPAPVGTRDPEGDGPDIDLAELAPQIQAEIDALEAQGINKIVLTSHLQQISREEELATLLDGVDVILSGGSGTLQFNQEQIDAGLLSSDATAENAEPGFPIFTQDQAGDPVLITSTGSEYQFLGRLVVEFDANGVILPESVDPAVSGNYETTAAAIDALAPEGFSSDTRPLVQELVDGVRAVTEPLLENVLGFSDVPLNGERGDVRTQETNLGNLTADANLFYAQFFDSTTQISIKNGGGIRASIGDRDVENNLIAPENGEVNQLDAENALRFNNGLSLIDLSTADLIEVLEGAVSATADGATPGQFPQVGGFRFTFDENDPSIGDDNEIVDVFLLNEDGSETQIVADGAPVAGAPEVIRTVTLNFLVNGGDDLPLVDLSENRVNLFETDDPESPDAAFPSAEVPTDLPMMFDFADVGTEQDAFAEYLGAEFGTPDEAFDLEETPIPEDFRIQRVDGDADPGDGDGGDGPGDGDGATDLPTLDETQAVSDEDFAEVEPGSLADGANEVFVTFLGEVAALDNAVGHYVYDLASGEILEGFIDFASTEDAVAGDERLISLEDGQGVAPFLVANAGNLGIDFSAFADGGLFFANPNGGAATIFDDVAPTVLVGDTPTGLAPFHGLDGDPTDGVNPLNPDDAVQAIGGSAVFSDVGEVEIVAFEDLKLGRADADYNDAVVAFSTASLDGSDAVASLVDQLDLGAGTV